MVSQGAVYIAGAIVGIGQCFFISAFFRMLQTLQKIIKAPVIIAHVIINSTDRDIGLGFSTLFACLHEYIKGLEGQR